LIEKRNHGLSALNQYPVLHALNGKQAPMQTLTPVPQSPIETLPAATAALKRLDERRSSLATELKALPGPHIALLKAIDNAEAPALEREIASLQQRLDDYWHTPDGLGETRYERFLNSLKQGLRDDVSLKLHERDLEPRHAACLPVSSTRPGESGTPATKNFSLHIQLHDDEQVEMAGALVMVHEQGHVLLALPGLGAEGFASQDEMREALAQWLNTPALKETLFNSLEQSCQDRLEEIGRDADVYLEPLTAADVRLQPITGEPYTHALDSLLTKQRKDVRHACAKQGTSQALIQKAINLRGLFGPAPMLELREMHYLESRYRQSLPGWVKLAEKSDLTTYTGLLRNYDEARAAMLSTLGAAASPESFAQAQLRTRIANDLGYALNPGTVMVSTRRTLPVTHEAYTVTRSLVELALYGLHPDDLLPGSEFLTQTTLDVDDAPLDTAYASLDAAYIALLVDELNLRAIFGEFQRAAYQKLPNQHVMASLTRTEITALAYAAKMQGHITAADFAIIEAIADPAQTSPNSALRVQQIKLDGRNVMNKLLVFRKENAAGQIERLIMVATDTPYVQNFQGFDNETQLRHELVSWSTSKERYDYLLNQVEVAARPDLQKQLSALRLKPLPKADFLQLIDLPDYESALRALTENKVRVALSEHAQHTPQWYLDASAAQRQELVALEDAAAGAVKNYQAKAHTHVKPFEKYVRERASEKINQLLGVPAGTVDPDLILITSERETVSYTTMLLRGYDDTLGFINPSADTQATFSGPEGVNLKALSATNVASSVRGKWLADDYIEIINSGLLNPASQGYDYRRKTSLLITQLQMKAAIVRSLLKKHISPQQYQWLRDSIDKAHLSDATTRDQYPIYPLQIHVDKPFIASGLKGIEQLVIPSTALTHVETVQGCFTILPTRIRLSALVYTPQAPDGMEFRLFSSFTESLKSPGMIDYYKDRCRIQSRKNLSFFLNDMKKGNANKPPVIPKECISDFAETCFNRPLQRMTRDVDETTTGRNDMLAKVIWNGIQLVVTAITLPFPPASFAVGALLSLHDGVRAIQALSDGDNETASAYLLTAILNGLGAAGDLHAGMKGFGGLLHRIGKHSSPDAALRPLQRQPSLPRYEDLFPAKLQDETFLLGKPNSNGHAEVFRSPSVSSREVTATGQFASRETSGTWSPLGSSDLPSDLSIKQSLQDVPRVNDGHAKGVYTTDGKTWIEKSGKTYQVQYDPQLRCWQIIDPDNPFAYFGKQPVRLDEHGQWQIIERPQLRGGGLDDESAYKPLQAEAPGTSAAALALSDYEMPVQIRGAFDMIVSKQSFDPFGIGMDEYFEAFYGDMHRTFTSLREKLYEDALAFFRTPSLPPRPHLPKLKHWATVDHFFENVFSHSNGIVLGEAAKSVASKRLLILNMPLLAEQRVEVLYIQHLFTDKHLAKLARYYRLGKKSRSGSHELRNHFNDVNEGALKNHTPEYDYYHLVKAAHRYNIDVRPLSSSVSYPFNNHPVTTAAGDAAAAQKMSNFFGHKVISGDVAAEPSTRWIALLDENLASTHQRVPGIAELEGVVSVRIKDIPGGRTTRISKGARIRGSGNQAARFDFTIEHPNPSLILVEKPLPPSTTLDERLMTAMGQEQGASAADRWAGEYGFVWDDADGWVRIEPDGWNENLPATALQRSLADATYEMPIHTRNNLHQLAYFERKGLSEGYSSGVAELDEVRELFLLKRSKLHDDARNLATVEMPARPTLPQVEPQISLPELLETLYKETDGVVIGEWHSFVASKQLIIDNLELLSQQNVKTLYLEHLLTDLHQADLDRFFETGQMSKSLLHDLRDLDNGMRTDPNNVYTFEQLVIKAQEHDLEIRAIDCAASYHIKDVGGRTDPTRQQMMNYFASRTIRQHQEVMGSHKWIALVGSSHSGTYQKVVPGIAELEGGISLNIAQVKPGQSKGVMPDPGELSPAGLRHEMVEIKGDYRVEIEVPEPIAAFVSPEQIADEEILHKSGMFRIRQGDGDQRMIVHRSRDLQIHRTPVLAHPDGKVYVFRPRWGDIHLKPYQDIDALIDGLKKIGLVHRG
jgi:hypothetical protein